MQHVNTPVTTTSSPLDRWLDGHALATHTYLSVEAIDPYITIQTNGTHAISRRMDDEIETTNSPKLVLNKPPKSPYLGIRDMTTGNTYYLI